jgi:general secretion pathway protein J
MTAHQSRRRDRIAGFTLIEALIATALMAMILVALATITRQWMPNWNRGMSRLQRDEALALGLDRLVADLAAAEFALAGPQALTPLFIGTSQSVTFVRTALSPNAHPGLEIVHFAETDSTNEPVLVRTQAPFEPDGIDDRQQLHFADPVALVQAPYRISFSYAGADRVWRDTWEQQPLLPRAIRLTVRDAATRRVLTASTATLLHVEAPADCITARSFAACLASHHQPTQSADIGKAVN